jgi:1-aminocyclopropane-1-carboxylate deaminase/D-cysteine desulfhydrase-like pyridoxal-dependent ACC family enzyme
MSRTDEQVQKMAEQLARLSEEVRVLRHTVAALANASGQAEVIAGLAQKSMREEQLNVETQRAADERRHAVTLIMASCEESGASARRKWLERELAGSDYGPMQQSDIDFYGLATE